jgi:hypothetical protein
MPLITVDTPSVSRALSVNTDVKFPVEVGSAGVPKTCQKILERARRDGKASFMDMYKVELLKGNIEALSNQLNNSRVSATEDITNQEFLDYLSTVENTQLPVLRLVHSCLSEELKVDQSKLKEAQKAYDTSKARFESINEDDEYVGYYESWFPLQRHVKESNLFVLFGISIFLLILSILTFLHLAGIEFKFILPSFQSEYGGSSFSFDIGDYQQYLIGGAVVGILFTAIGLWRKWF